MAPFIKERYPKHDIESIITALIQKDVDIYKLLDQLAGYLTDNGLSNGSAKLYMAALRSYLQFHDVDIIPAKFKHRVNMPKERKEDEYARWMLRK